MILFDDFSDILFFGFYTRETPYENEYRGIEHYFKAYGLNYSYLAMANRGSWQKNTQMKAEVVAHFLHNCPGKKLCYLDVDSIIFKKPVDIVRVLEESPEVDIAAPVCFGGEFINSCMPMRSNSRTVALVQRWRDLNAQYPDVLPDGQAAWDQRTLWMAIGENKTTINFKPLNPSYHYMADLTPARHPGVEPIIVAARAATRFRAQIDGGLGMGN